LSSAESLAPTPDGDKRKAAPFLDFAGASRWNYPHVAEREEKRMRNNWLASNAIWIAAALGLGPVPSGAEQPSLTISSWGGAFQKAQREAWFNVVERELDITIKEDTTSGIADVRAQVASGRPTWDLSSQGTYTCGILEKEGKLERLDPAIVKTDGIAKELKSEYWASHIVYSVAIGWRQKAFPGKAPGGWAAMWDVASFPGQRSMRRHPIYNLEAALIADGVAMHELYPINADRAFKKLEQLKPNVLVWWNSGAQSAQVLQDGEVELVGAWNGRIQAAMAEPEGKGGKLGITFEQQMLVSDCWLIPKGAPHRDLAMKAMAIMLRPEVNARIANYINYAPANVEAYATGVIPKDKLPELPNAPGNAQRGFVLNVDWWVQNADEMVKRFDAFVQQ
jgi:putative spermidine/putrescine transport system substrate-binding protein